MNEVDVHYDIQQVDTRDVIINAIRDGTWSSVATWGQEGIIMAVSGPNQCLIADVAHHDPHLGDVGVFALVGLSMGRT